MRLDLLATVGHKFPQWVKPLGLETPSGTAEAVP